MANGEFMNTYRDLINENVQLRHQVESQRRKEIWQAACRLIPSRNIEQAVSEAIALHAEFEKQLATEGES